MGTRFLSDRTGVRVGRLVRGDGQSVTELEAFIAREKRWPRENRRLDRAAITNEERRLAIWAARSARPPTGDCAATTNCADSPASPGSTGIPSTTGGLSTWSHCDRVGKPSGWADPLHGGLNRYASTQSEGLSMGLEMGLWRVDGSPIKLQPSQVPLESQLESLIEQDPSLLGNDLLLIGRQIPTAFGKFIDLLGVDVDGVLHILELKRDRTPREVVAQLLDYASWVQGLSNTDIRGIWQGQNPALVFDIEFGERFGVAPPDQLNTSHVLTIIASSLDTSTERIVTYLNATYGVPINAVFFRYFLDGDRSYLARTWLIDDTGPAAAPAKTRPSGTATSNWNGLDWYVSFGEEPGGRNWNDARQFGFVSAGGGEWYSRTLRSLPIGARVFVFIPGSPRGYVGVGTVTAAAVPATDAILTLQGESVNFTDLPLEGNYIRSSTDNDAEDKREYVVAIEWDHTVPRSEGLWITGMFANQNSACRLKSQFTIDSVAKAFDLDD